MRPAVALVLLGCAVLAGCLGAPSGPAATEANSGTDPTTPASEPVAVSYELRPGTIPDDLAHVYLELGVYLAENPDDIYACTDDAPLFDGQYDPTATPLATPAGDCRAFDVGRIDIVDLAEPTTLGPFEAEPSFVGGHTLVVHDVTIVLDNGTKATGLYDIDFRALTERSRPAGTHGVEVWVEVSNRTDDVPWRYAVRTQRYDPNTD